MHTCLKACCQQSTVGFLLRSWTNVSQFCITKATMTCSIHNFQHVPVKSQLLLTLSSLSFPLDCGTLLPNLCHHGVSVKSHLFSLLFFLSVWQVSPWTGSPPRFSVLKCLRYLMCWSLQHMLLLKILSACPTGCVPWCLWIVHMYLLEKTS